MPLIDAVLAEFDHELANTRKLLERVPEDKLAFKPHDRSMTLGRLCGHIAEIPMWGRNILGQDSFDLEEASGMQPANPETRQELLQLLERNASILREAAEGTKDDALMASWSLLKGAEAVVELPRIAALRSFVLSHVIHHRGQLTVFLRLLDVPLPALYGPSADDAGF